MSFTFSDSELDGVWQVAYEGKVDYSIRLSALDEAVRVVSGKQVRGILVDFRNVDIVMKVFEDFEFGVRIAEVPELRHARIAYLHDPGQTEASQFLRTVEANRGRNTATFTDRDEAMKWLEGGGKRP